jgi:hypothetical protein
MAESFLGHFFICADNEDAEPTSRLALCSQRSNARMPWRSFSRSEMLQAVATARSRKMRPPSSLSRRFQTTSPGRSQARYSVASLLTSAICPKSLENFVFSGCLFVLSSVIFNHRSP